MLKKSGRTELSEQPKYKCKLTNTYVCILQGHFSFLHILSRTDSNTSTNYQFDLINFLRVLRTFF